jgi:hypothetical protein
MNGTSDETEVARATIRKNHYLVATIIDLLPCVPFLFVLLKAFWKHKSWWESWMEELWEHGWVLFFGSILCGLVSAIMFFRCKTGLTLFFGILALLLNAAVVGFVFVIIPLAGARQ